MLHVFSFARASFLCSALRAASYQFFVVTAALFFVACETVPGGQLVTGEWAFAPAVQKAGSFELVWSGSAPANAVLSIRRSDNPEKVLWRSVPGQAFVVAARGEEEVHESRGMFTVNDTIHERCEEQSLDRVDSNGEAALIAGRLRCGRGHTPYELTFTETDEGHLRFQLTVANPDFNRTYLVYASDADEGFYGFGEQFTYFDTKGRKLPIFVSEQGIGRGAEPITTGANLSAGAGGTWHSSYAGVPHYVTSEMNSFFLENYEYTSFDLREADRVIVETFSSKMTGRILYGESPAELVSEYTEYSGRMRELPDWIHDGAIIGMQGGTEKVRRVHAQLQELGTPLAAYWLQDWEGQRKTTFGKQLWWNWELDQDRYPGWSELRRDLQQDGIELMVYINPFLVDVSEKENARRNLFAEAKAAGYLVKDPEGEIYLIPNTSFSAAIIDLTNPDARKWIKDVIKGELLTTGTRGWMADFGEALPYDAVLFSGESPATYHNKYPEVWQQLNREAINEAGLGSQVVFFSRSGYTKSPGLTTLFWLGDQLVSWDRYDGIKTAVTGLLSSGLSGYSLNHSDIGGYTTITHAIADYHRSEELLKRWTELSAFNVVFRTHEGNQPENNVQIYDSPEMLQFFDRFARIYAALAPYRKALVKEASTTGMPVVRHLWMHYPDDAKVRRISHEAFLFGPDFLVCPVLDPDRLNVRAYLPKGQWVHLWSGDVIDSPGEWREFTAPPGKPAVFYKKNSQAGADLRAYLETQGML